VLPVLANLTLIAYACATGLALAYLVQREELVHRLGHLAMLAGWAIHSVSLIVLAVETRRPPLGSLSEAVSTAVWVVVLVREYRVSALSAFVMPVVLVLSLKSTAARPATLEQLGDAFRGAWLWVHIALALIGIAAFVLNFAGALMYLLQERQLKAKRPGAFYYRLPDLQTLDRLTYRTLALGFPFLTTGIIMGAMWARTAWGTMLTFDPFPSLASLAWLIYAATLAGRTLAGLHGRRAAYFAVFGFGILVLTLGAGLFLPGRHGT
jgi:ABC-type transport system involved in cytochrome c biogenesis permease subunit